MSLTKNLCSGLSDLTTAGTQARREIQTATSVLRDSRVDSGSVDLETPPDASPIVDETKPGERTFFTDHYDLQNTMNNLCVNKIP